MANTGTTAYPAAFDDFTNVGTATYEDDEGFGHTDLHNQAHEAIEAIEAVMGTTAGTSVLKNVLVGQFVATTAGTETLTNKTLTSPVINTSFTGTGKATGAEIDTGTEDAKIVTPKAIADSKALLGDKTSTGDIIAADAKDIKFASGAKMERVDGNIVLTPETGKVVKIQSVNQVGTTNTYKPNVFIQQGWNFITGDNSSGNNKVVTFPVAFSNVYGVACTPMGVKDSSDPTGPSDLSNGPGTYYGSILGALSTTGFAYQIANASGTISTARRVGFSWIAIGD